MMLKVTSDRPDKPLLSSGMSYSKMLPFAIGFCSLNLQIAVSKIFSEHVIEGKHVYSNSVFCR